MSLDEELGQLIMVEYGDTTYSDDLNTMVNTLHAGGVIMYEFQMMTAAQTRHDIDLMQKNATFPLLISTDEEGGIVHRLSNIYPPRPSALSIYESGSLNYAAQQGHLVAHDLKALGINVNLAPDVDVALIPDAPDQVTRTFGFTTSSVIQYAGAYMKAMQGDGVLATIKHYPGLGDANIDAHFGLPIVNRTREQIYSTELAPFKYFIQSRDKLENPGLIMPTDVLMPAIDPRYPAELSHIFMTDILRKQFGYDGVSLTDALYMKGVEVNGQQIDMGQAAVMALNAGNDMLLGATGTAQMLDMLNAIRAALQNGTLSKARVDEAATRIIALKMQSHLMPAVAPQS
jgi:beta-N-acetylhexosaminidase